MGCRCFVTPALGIHWAALLELGPEVLPLEGELTIGDWDDTGGFAGSQNAGRVESVPPIDSVRAEPRKVTADRAQWVGVIPKPLQLGVVAIPTGSLCEHCLREKRLTPAGDKPDGIQLPRVK